MKLSKTARRNLTGYLFIAPNLIGFSIFLVAPVVFSLFISFTSWDMLSGIGNIRFMGLENYFNLVKDGYFIKSFINNLFYTSLFVPLTVIFALLLAVILNEKIRGRNVLRTMYFMPYIANAVAICGVWMALLQPGEGPVSQLFKTLGVSNSPMWLADKHYVMFTITLINVWLNVGYNMVLFLGGLQNIPVELYEAAETDGAGRCMQFWKITLPLLSPTMFFVLVTTIIHSFKVFASVNIMTQGGPGDASTVIVYDIYVTAFRLYKMGYSSAMAWILFIMVFGVTLLQWRGQKKWVGYSL